MAEQQETGHARLVAPLRPDLWRLLEPAVRAVRRAGLEYEALGKYTPRLSVPRFSVNDAGWPSMTARDELIPRQGPIDWGSLVGLKKAQLVPLGVGDIAEVAAVVSAVCGEPELAARLSLPRLSKDGQSTDAGRVAFDVVRLIADIVGRAEALGVEDGEGLLGIYVEREAAILADRLTGDLLIPLLMVRFNEVDVLELGSDVSIERIDEATQRARARPVSSSENPYLTAAASHAIVIRDAEFTNPHWLTRVLRGWEEELDRARIEVVCQAIEVATGRPVGYAEVWMRPKGWADGWIYDLPALHSVQTVKRYPTELNDGPVWNTAGAAVSADDLVNLPTIFTNLRSAGPRVLLAARRLFQSHLRTEDDDIVIDACIGIEALVGEGRDELTHRMSQRAATALARSSLDADAPRIYAVMKRVYGERSKIVHGIGRKADHLMFEERRFSTSETALVLLRYLLLSTTESSPAWTPADLDRAILHAVNAHTLKD